MKCPSCKSIMYSKENPIIKDFMSSKLRLHCYNNECPAQLEIEKYTSHMLVTIYTNQSWICDEYHLPFFYKHKWYAMVGEKYQGYLGYPNYFINNQISKIKKTSVYKIDQLSVTYSYSKYYGYYLNRYRPPKEDTISIPFVPISTGDDMHEQAQSLFNRLIKLIVFK